MKVEIPELKRCCCCVPLRHGLIAFGYIKLVLMLILISFLTYILVWVLSSRFIYIEDAVFMIGFILIVMVDICLTIAFIVGGYQKSAKLLRVYYVYQIVFLCLFTLFFTWLSALDLMRIGKYMKYMDQGYSRFITALQVWLLIGIFLLGLQVYIIVLIRSEVNKLRNCSSYRFTNLTTEAEITLVNGPNEQENDSNVEQAKENGIERINSQPKNQQKKKQNSFSYNKF